MITIDLANLDVLAAFLVSALAAIGAIAVFALLEAITNHIADRSPVWRHNIRVAFVRCLKRSKSVRAWLES